MLRVVAQQWGTEMDAGLRAAGHDDIRASHATVLPFVDNEGTAVSELARRAKVRKQTMLQSVTELEHLGYVARLPDPTDRRSRLVVLTAKGRSLRPLSHRTGAAIEARWASLLSEVELEHMRCGLRTLMEAFDQAPRDPSTT